MRRSICHTMCNKAAVLSCAARGETVLSLPPEAPRLCLRRRRATALCDLPVRSAVHGWIAAAVRASVWASTLRIYLRTHVCMRYHASAHLASLTNKDVSHTKLRCRATWTGHLTCSRRLSACAAIGRTTGQGRRIQRPTVLPNRFVGCTLLFRGVRAGLPPRRGSLELRQQSVADRVSRTGASCRPAQVARCLRHRQGPGRPTG